MKVGDRVEHEAFGNGIIITATVESIVVDFGKFEVTFDVKAQSALRVV